MGDGLFVKIDRFQGPFAGPAGRRLRTEQIFQQKIGTPRREPWERNIIKAKNMTIRQALSRKNSQTLRHRSGYCEKVTRMCKTSHPDTLVFLPHTIMSAEEFLSHHQKYYCCDFERSDCKIKIFQNKSPCCQSDQYFRLMDIPHQSQTSIFTVGKMGWRQFLLKI